ncbi:MAG: hypothetical protein DPW15_01805, partial [Chloroflexi bacterium]|nr:hypothetical protein [Chloroflexota bacterium]NUQ60495.1 hypothetical protein [Anaerolineales bacterium]
MDTYTQRIEQIRAERAQSFASDPLSWLNLVGLFWLEDGENNFGSSSEAKISLLQFPQPVCGHFLFKNGKVTVHPTVEMSMNGGGVGSRPLFTDKDAKPDLLEIGRLSIKIIVRGDATLVRV